MHTHITKQNVKAAIRDDKAHMDYLKRDVKDDQRAGGKYKDINQTADEKHISKLAGDVKYDEKKEGMSRYKDEGMSRMHSPLNVDPEAKMKEKKDYSFGQKALGTVKNVGNYAAAGASKILSGTAISAGKGGKRKSQMSYDQQRASDFQKSHLDSAKKRKEEGSAFFRHTSEHSTEEYMARKDAAIKKAKGMSRYSSPANNITYGDKSGPTGYIGEERYDLNNYNPVDDRAGMSRHVSTHDGSGGHTITKKMGKQKPKWRVESEKKFQAKKDSIATEKARLLEITKARRKKIYGKDK
jgi:hypothetical protein